MADTEDTETLAELLWSVDGEYSDVACEMVLTSDWLLARDERIRADEREKLAGAVRDCRENGLPEGHDSHPYTESFEEWLLRGGAPTSDLEREGELPSHRRAELDLAATRLAGEVEAQ